jgi:ribulose-5-phosphate 4-epimerase/fuculose-1-phosphate aldolase
MVSSAATGAVETDSSIDSVAELIATGCQVLAATGLTPDILGHVSVRIAGDRLLVRCRGPRESGLAFTTAEDVKAVPLDGPPDPDALGRWSAPNELPIHTAIMRRNAEVTAVVHAHPPAVVAMSVAGFPWQPIVGAFDIPAARLAADGIPVWPRAVLVNTRQLGDDLAGCQGDRPVGVLRGHGLVSVGYGPPERALPQAIVNAVAVDRLARLTLQVRSAGATPAPISATDLRQLPDLGAGFTVETMWRHLVRRAAAATRPDWR